LRVACARTFRVAYSTQFDRAAAAIARLKPSVLCFDFDHPDQHRLQAMQDLKRAYARLPFLMLTVYHSEALAIWAFRAGTWNYLVKPVSIAEFDENLAALASIVRRTPMPHSPYRVEAAVPHELSVAPVDARVAQLQSALHFIKQHFHTRISEAEVAGLCGLTRFEFSRNFHAAFGVTFREYVTRVRIAEARRLLAEGAPSITDVAYATGFTDGSYFARVFKFHTGVLPSEYHGSIATPASPREPLPVTRAPAP
jgi:AraC-like DNA-binding protein